MKSSNRQPRYRRRFLTRTRTEIQHLGRVRDLLLQDREANRYSTWEILRHGLCLKSAQETFASPDAIDRARAIAIKHLTSATSGWGRDQPARP